MEDVLHACLHNLSFDAQCEGDRGEWMLSLIEAAGANDVVVPKLIESASQPPKDNYRYWHDVQRCGVMKALARRGESAARQVLYRMFRKSACSLDLIGCEEIIDLDGADGLIFVCERLGGWIADDPELTVDEAPVTFYDERHGMGAAARVLESVRDANAKAARYLDFIAARWGVGTAPPEVEDSADTTPGLPAGGGHRNLSNVRLDPSAPNPRTRRIESRTGGEVIDWVRSSSDDEKGYWLSMWGRRATDGDLGAVAEALQSETDPTRLCKYLRVFQHRRIPIVTDQIVGLAENKNRDVRWVANRVLSNVPDPRIRALALRKLRPEPIVEGSLHLFEASYEPGDHEAIEHAVFMPEDWDDLHTIVFSIAEVFTKHPLPEATQLMLFVYEHSPCGNCRSRSTEVLAEINAVPGWLAEECRFDAMDDIHERFAEVGDED